MARGASGMEGGAVRLLDISPPGVSRIIWNSAAAKATWAEAIRRISSAVHAAEIRSVELGQRPCATLTIRHDELTGMSLRHPELVFLPIRNVKKFDGFSHAHHDIGSGETDYFIHLVVAREFSDAAKFRAAYFAGDNDAQGALLGFPECCRRFFSEVWPAGYIDPIWQAAMATPGAAVDDGQAIVDAHPYSNPLLRYIGLRVGFHIPCSFQCAETIAQSETRLDLIDEGDRKLLEALLSMPMTWDAYHGIAHVKTPLFWLVNTSVPCAERHTVEVKGKYIPREGVWND